MPGQPLFPNESDLEVLHQRFLLRRFFSSPCYLPPFQRRKFPFLYLSCFRNIQPVKTILAPEDEYCFSLLLLQAIVIIMGIALINAKAKSVIVFAIILFLWGHSIVKNTGGGVGSIVWGLGFWLGKDILGFFSSPCYLPPFQRRKFPFLYLSCFKNIQPVKTILPLRMNIVFIAAPASYRNNDGYCFNQCESKVCYSFCNHIVLMGATL